MKLKNLVQEDFSNYKFCSMFLGFPSCDWKCEKDCGRRGLCQNAALAKANSIDIAIEDIIKLYITNPLSSAIVCGGLEPFDSWSDLIELVTEIRKVSSDDVVIYTGYNREEILDKVEILRQFSNIIIKFGRFVPDKETHYDEILGVVLASPNQKAERIS